MYACTACVQLDDAYVTWIYICYVDSLFFIIYIVYVRSQFNRATPADDIDFFKGGFSIILLCENIVSF